MAAIFDSIDFELMEKSFVIFKVGPNQNWPRCCAPAVHNLPPLRSTAPQSSHAHTSSCMRLNVCFSSDVLLKSARSGRSYHGPVRPVDQDMHRGGLDFARTRAPCFSKLVCTLAAGKGEGLASPSVRAGLV